MRSIIATVLVVFIAAGGNLTSAEVIPPRSHRHYPRRHSNDFIRLACRSTRYPAVCVQSLSAYAPAVRRSPRQLARTALSVSAAGAHDASAFVSRLSAHAAGSRSPRSRGGGAVHDCVEVLSDSVDRLRRSAREMYRMGRYGSPRFRWHLGNVQTWTSAALTDLSTCLDSLSEDAGAAGVRSQIKGRIVKVTQLTSNALALVNRLQ